MMVKSFNTKHEASAGDCLMRVADCDAPYIERVCWLESSHAPSSKQLIVKAIAPAVLFGV